MIELSPIKKERRKTEELLRLLCKTAEERQAQDVVCRFMADLQRRINLVAAEITNFNKEPSSKKEEGNKYASHSPLRAKQSHFRRL